MSDGKNIRTLKITMEKRRYELWKEIKQIAEAELDQELTDAEFLEYLLANYEIEV